MNGLLAFGIVLLILLIILLLIFIALPLYFTARLLDEDEGLGKALGATILLIISFVVCLIVIPWALVGLIVAIIINLFIIKATYETDWGKAFVMWIVTIFMALLIFIIIPLVLGIGLYLAFS
jgi:hypothetical protein